jgi:hypothetical protein
LAPLREDFFVGRPSDGLTRRHHAKTPRRKGLPLVVFRGNGDAELASPLNGKRLG